MIRLEYVYHASYIWVEFLYGSIQPETYIVVLCVFCEFSSSFFFFFLNLFIDQCYIIDMFLPSFCSVSFFNCKKIILRSH